METDILVHRGHPVGVAGLGMLEFRLHHQLHDMFPSVIS